MGDASVILGHRKGTIDMKLTSNIQKRFCYVYGHYQKKDGRPSLWKRVKVPEEVEALRKKASNYNVFATVQQYSSPEKKEGELQYAPLYFDLDKNDKYGFDYAKEDCNKLIHYFTMNFDLPKECIRTFFSGNKGFHVYINPEILGVQPHSKIAYVFKRIALYLKSLLELKTLDTKSIYSITRQMRLTDSIHHKSGLFKVELFHFEIDFTEEKIRALAQQPRGELYDEEALEGLLPSESAQKWYNGFIDIYNKQELLERLKPHRPIKQLTGYPACVTDLIDNHIRVSGSRNLATLCLSCFFKDQGLPGRQAVKIIKEWALKIPKEFTSTTDKNKLIAGTASCVKAIYDSKTYHFVCSVMRSLGDIACDHDDCKFTTKEDQAPEKIVDVHLSEASKAAFIGTKLRTSTIVVGKDTSPYIIPAKIRIECRPSIQEKSSCGICVMKDRGGKYEFSIKSQDPAIVEMTQCSNTQQLGIIKRIVGITNCKRGAQVTTLEYMNIEEVELIPEIDYHIDRPDEASDYVTRKGFFGGHGIKLNEPQEITCYTIPDPRNQHSIHLFSSYKSAETSLSSFKMTNKLYKDLSVFKMDINGFDNQKDAVAAKLDEIHNDLERNIHHIWQRRDMFIAMDLVYHSALKFKFRGDLVEKGWTECLIIGDSGTGKSDGFKRIKNHYSLGARVSGEGARRTGLAWTWQQTAQRWFVRFGTLVQNDRRLVALDEASGIEDEELSKLTDLRSTGIADATGGPIPAKANARTRIIWLSNARNGQPISSFTQGVLAIPQLFRRTEDVRRLDFAMAVRSEDIDDVVINRNPLQLEQIPHVYTSYLCRNLILWAWTRGVKDIIFDKDAEDIIAYYASLLSSKYSSIIPLVEPSVQRNKLSRLGVALAQRLFSTEDGFSVRIRKSYIDFIYEFLTRIYDSDALAYRLFSKRNVKKVDLDSFAYANIGKSFDIIPDNETLMDILLSLGFFRKSHLMDCVGYDKEQAKTTVLSLLKSGIIGPHSKGFKVTPVGSTFLRNRSREIEKGHGDLS